MTPNKYTQIMISTQCCGHTEEGDLFQAWWLSPMKGGEGREE